MSASPVSVAPYTPSRAGLLAGHLTEVLWLAILMVIPLTMKDRKSVV